MVFAPDGRSLWVASPGRDKVAEQWGHSPVRPGVGPPDPAADPERRAGHAPRRHPGRAVPRRGGLGVAPGGPGWRGGRGSDPQVANGVDRGVGGGDGPGRPEGGRERRVRLRDRERVARHVPEPLARREIRDRLGPARGEPVRRDDLHRGREASRRSVGNSPRWGPVPRWKLHFENNMRTGLAIKDDQLHRWSAAEPGVLGPGVPTPFRSMLYGPSADGRSVISPTEGRVFDTGAWPPRPSGVRFAHPGWQRSRDAWTEQSPDGRFTATWIWHAESDRRLWRLPRPHSRPALPPAELARQPERKLDYQFGPVRPARDECGPLVASAGMATVGRAMRSITSGSWT